MLKVTSDDKIVENKLTYQINWLEFINKKGLKTGHLYLYTIHYYN
jgi:hypothetical protein